MTGRAATHRNASHDFVREVNENIAALGERFGLHEERLELMCECGASECTARIAVPADEYERVRADRCRIVAAGHEPGGPTNGQGGYVVLDD